MPHDIEPERWQKFFDLVRQGYSRTQASSRSGISLKAVRAFERGDPGSSGHRWVTWRRGQTACPTCGKPK